MKQYIIFTPRLCKKKPAERDVKTYGFFQEYYSHACKCFHDVTRVNVCKYRIMQRTHTKSVSQQLHFCAALNLFYCTPYYDQIEKDTHTNHAIQKIVFVTKSTIDNNSKYDCMQIQFLFSRRVYERIHIYFTNIVTEIFQTQSSYVIYKLNFSQW